MLCCIPFAWIYDASENLHWDFLICSSITILFGSVMRLSTKSDKNAEIKKRDGYLIVVGGWICMSLFGALPYIISESIPYFTDAFFETMSGFTTTGSTILNDIESLPRSILFWRSMTQWIGGMGIIVLTIAVLPLLGIGGMELFVAEAPGPTKDKIHPRIKETAKRLWIIYFGLTALETIILLFLGLDFFDAINHALTTTSTGGFSTKQQSIAAFNNPWVETVIVLFMLAAGTNFTLIYFGLKLKLKKLLKNDEFKWFILSLTSLIIILTLIHFFTVDPSSIVSSFRVISFQVVSIITTTGFTTADYTAWTPMLLLIFFGLMFVGGSAGSTAGGFKVMRHLLIIKNGLLQFKRILHPNAILPIRYNKKSVSSEIMYNILGFFIVYMLSFIAGTLVFSILGLDFSSSLGVSASSLGNVGPSIGDFGPSSTFYDLPVLAKWWSSFLMLLGRLELYTVLIIITPYFWRNR